MNKKVFKTLEFDKIIKMLKDLASSDKGKIYCESLSPITDIDKITERQKETHDALSRVLKYGNISFSGVYDIFPIVKRLEIGGSLNPSEFLRIASLLSAAKNAISYNNKIDDEDFSDSLSSYFNKLDDAMPLLRHINDTILSEDEISDDATMSLFSIRKKIRGFRDRIQGEMTRLLSSSLKDYLQESLITVRDDRYCFPVKAEYKSLVKGIVHYQSKSGQTLFIEPLAVINLDNELKELQGEEKQEIDKFLAELSNEAAGYINAFNSDFRNLTELDFIFAKAYLAIKMNAAMPLLNMNGRLDLKKARHPLLDSKTVVPIDIILGIGFNQLIITGPNTGGKTVTLKTVGLLSLMAQSGLHIPCLERSEICIFNNIYADIGDEQSIEQSLSTFSSHMTNIVKILNSIKQSSNLSLCLFDELCSGTDPVEGASLAISILKNLKSYNTRVISTTHYSELKHYALSEDNVENASCEFSVETLSPTYKLLIGIPGKSNAFSISLKLGIPSSIIENAKNLISNEDKSFEDMITDLESKRIDIDKKTKEINEAKDEIENLKKELLREKNNLKSKKAAIISDANRRAMNIIKEAKEETDKTIKEFRKLKTSVDKMPEMESLRTKLGQNLKNRGSKISLSPSTSHKSLIKAKDLHVGDMVKVYSLNMKGTIHSLPDKKGNLIVSIGIMQSKVKLNDIELIKEDDTAKKFREEKRKTATVSYRSNTMTISPEIRLLGLTVDEAIQKVDKYIDDAYMAHLKSVRIVHGKGTGALRSAIQDMLSQSPYVKSFDNAAYGEGDMGVTIAHLY